MAHFAQLDELNIVLRVIVINNSDTLGPDGNESEAVGVAFCQSLEGADTIWKQTSYNATFRKNYAVIGGTYRADLDAFVAPKPYPSWLLDETTCQWEAPIPYPDDGNQYEWDEATQQWVQIPL